MEFEFESFIRKMKDFYTATIDFIDSTVDSDSKFTDLTHVLKKRDFLLNHETTKLLLQLLSKISNNHHRTSDFFNKLEKIIQYLIKLKPYPFFDYNKTSDLFSSDFKYNKQFIILLMQNDVINANEIFNQFELKSFLDLKIESITANSKIIIDRLQIFYFYPSIKDQLEEEIQKQIEGKIIEKFCVENFSQFQEKCQIGENDSYICSLIREDSVQEFISYTSQINLPLMTTIKPSFFETNSFLIDKEPTLIEYAAFFGSIQIMRYLKYNEVPLESSLWLYAVHSNNPEIIRFLEDNKVELFDDALAESIKCHHNDISDYLNNQLNDLSHFDDKFGFLIADTLNFYFFPDEINSLISESITDKRFRLYQICSVFETITIPSSVTEIGNFALEKCSSLKEIIIPSSVTKIGKCAFFGCSSLTKISIPSSVTEIGTGSFCECSSLTQISIPSSVTKIDPFPNQLNKNYSKKLYIEEEIFFDELKCIARLDNRTVYIADLPIDYDKSSPTCCIDRKFIRELFENYDLSSSDAVNVITRQGKDGNPHAFAELKFKTRDEALRAVSDFNYTKLNGLPFGMTLIDEKDKFILANNDNILVIKNFGPDIEVSQFHDALSKYGDIIRCKIPTYLDENGSEKRYMSLGYGFICFSNPESAKQATIELRGVALNGNPIEIEPLMSEINYYGLFEGCSSLAQISISSSLTSIGPKTFRKCSSLTQIKIPSSVTSIGNYAFDGCSSLIQIEIPSSVTEIGDSAFSECRSLTQITIPSSVTSIGDYAFSECSSITQITIPSSVTSIGNYVFNGCLSLAQITIPSSVTSIGNNAFSGCSSLTQIKIPSSVASIGNYAFDGCSSLMQIEIPSSVTEIGDSIFINCQKLDKISIISCKEKRVEYIEDTFLVFKTNSANQNYDTLVFVNPNANSITIPSFINTIKASAFYDCSSLTQITIPSSVTSIQQSAFSKCSSLAQITIPSSVTSIGDYVFSGCSRLTQITIPSSVTMIGNHAFEACGSLTQITIPSSLISIGNYAFFGCSSLTQITIPSSVTKIGNHAFEACGSLAQITIPSSVTSIQHSAFSKCSSLAQITIPSSVTRIEDYAFSGCSRLTQIAIPSYVTRIGDYAFEACGSLTQITIPSYVTIIGDHAFEACGSLTQITIPSYLNSIRNYAFFGCSSLTQITFEIPSYVTSIGDYAFKACASLTQIIIPSSVTKIGKCAFVECKSLTQITIPSSVTTIGDYAFDECSSLEKIIISSSVTELNSQLKHSLERILPDISVIITEG